MARIPGLPGYPGRLVQDPGKGSAELLARVSELPRHLHRDGGRDVYGRLVGSGIRSLPHRPGRPGHKLTTANNSITERTPDA